MHRHSPGRSCCALLCALLICAQAHATPDQAVTMTGDWGGVRQDWFTRGVAPRGDYIGEAVDVIDNGEGASGARYAQQLRFGLDLAMDRLAGWRGGAFHLTLNDRRGRSASADLVGNRFALQQVYGGTYTRLSEVSFDYGFAGGGYLKLGFYAMGSHFGLLAAGNSFLNSALCAHPLSMTGNSGWYNYPVARWGAEAGWPLAARVVLRGGWFQVNPQLRGNNVHTAFRPFASGTTGSLFVLELAWTPGAGGPHAGSYQVGAYADTSRARRLGTAASVSGRDGVWLLAEQKLSAETADPTRGLTVFGEYMRTDQATSPLRHWRVAGLYYQGIGTRSQDRLALGYASAKVNGALRAAQRVELADTGVPSDSPLYQLTDAERLYELAYTAQLRPWLTLRPDLQYIVDPGTFSYRRAGDALAVGLQVRATF
ncbi:carbohydrate porin [Pseudoxanthomonas winnipegensis]|uniref:Carbohydrate porin n=1 Tax=Pseudoxanthomonas winnipegensis TaxID=2480810 RepID=A0A4Q8M1I3_9GAMM|nr:carbohydrate porin [Pseudoxanthomonas winnipegensis]TAA40134.1 carbohydrate porin [Pseudoxanthomonas winnipegensis]